MILADSLLPVLGILTQWWHDWLLYFVLLICFATIGLIIYYQIILPYVILKQSEIPFPPEVGEVFTFVVNESDRNPSFTISRTHGDLVTKCSAISENHLTFVFKKNQFAEEYDITIKRGGPTLFKPPRVATYSVMDSTEKLESHEIIGKEALFRISRQLIKERMINYFEISLTSKFFFNKTGKERLQFIFKIEKIHPSLNLAMEDSDGNFPFGKEEHKDSQSEANADTI
ncbi:MAG: hypothetical protein KDK36_09185 [Leptospiraceae bacterium]|nr:hypothetical protein [Leptospiraceae bacterium]